MLLFVQHNPEYLYTVTKILTCKWGRADNTGQQMNELKEKNLFVCVYECPYTWLTPRPPTMVCQMFALAVTTWLLPCAVIALCICVWACVRVRVRVEVLPNRWSNLIHVSFLPRCPLALMVCWWCYLGLTSILSALFLESAHRRPAPPRSASPPPSRQPRAPGYERTAVLRETGRQVEVGLMLPGCRLLWVKCVWKNSVLFTVREQTLLCCSS